MPSETDGFRPEPVIDIEQAIEAAMRCSDQPAESCSDDGCPVHGWETDPRDGDDDA